MRRGSELTWRVWNTAPTTYLDEYDNEQQELMGSPPGGSSSSRPPVKPTASRAEGETAPGPEEMPPSAHRGESLTTFSRLNPGLDLRGHFQVQMGEVKTSNHQRIKGEKDLQMMGKPLTSCTGPRSARGDRRNLQHFQQNQQRPFRGGHSGPGRARHMQGEGDDPLADDQLLPRPSRELKKYGGRAMGGRDEADPEDATMVLKTLPHSRERGANYYIAR